MSLPEVLLWQYLRGSPGGLKFRRQHPAGPFVLDFFCAKANLCVEIDGKVHDLGNRPERDAARDVWLSSHRIETVRVPASQVLADPGEVAGNIVRYAQERLVRFGKSPPSDATASATSPSQVDGEEMKEVQ